MSKVFERKKLAHYCLDVFLCFSFQLKYSSFLQSLVSWPSVCFTAMRKTPRDRKICKKYKVFQLTKLTWQKVG